MTKPSFYVTTSIPYASGTPHIGNAIDWLYADATARYYKQHGYDVAYSAGADEHGSKIYEKAVEAGAAIVNDVSGGTLDAEMYKTVAKLKVPYILMHMRGNPKTMLKLADYKNVTVEVLKDLSEKIALGRAEGINDIIADPGFGFAKTREQSFQLLNNLELFENLEVPILVGVSRKSMIYKTLETSAENALNGTTSLNTIALLKGASILRVHDVKEAVECVKLFQNLKS